MKLTSQQREEQRIRFRQRLMTLPGGPAWLLHVGRMYEFNEKLLAPDHIGLPKNLLDAHAQYVT